MTLRLQSLYEHKMAEIMQKHRQVSAQANEREEQSRSSRRRHHQPFQQAVAAEAATARPSGSNNNNRSIEVPESAERRQFGMRSAHRLRNAPPPDELPGRAATLANAPAAASMSSSRLHALNNSDLYSSDNLAADTSLNTSGGHYSTRRSRQLATTASANTAMTNAGSSSRIAVNGGAVTETNAHITGPSSSSGGKRVVTDELDKSFASTNATENDENETEEDETELINKSKRSGLRASITANVSASQNGGSNSMSKRFRVSRADSSTAVASFNDAIENSNDCRDTSLNTTPPVTTSIASIAARLGNGVKSEPLTLDNNNTEKVNNHNENANHNDNDDDDDDEIVVSKKSKRGGGRVSKVKIEDDYEEYNEDVSEDNKSDDDDDYNASSSRASRTGSKRTSKKRNVDEAVFDFKPQVKKNGSVATAVSSRPTRAAATSAAVSSVSLRLKQEDKENDGDNDSFLNRTQNSTTNSEDNGAAQASHSNKSKSRKSSVVQAARKGAAGSNRVSSRGSRRAHVKSYCELSGEEDVLNEEHGQGEEENDEDDYSSGNEEISRSSGTKRGRRSQSHNESIKKKPRVVSKKSSKTSRRSRTRRDDDDDDEDEDSTESDSDETSSILNNAVCNNY
jgi:hypothetical protein